MPSTSSGDTVYADPAEVVDYVQTNNETFSLSETSDGDGDGASPWQEFLESLQVKAKARIDAYVNRPDFEDHPGDTHVIDVGPSEKRILELPSPVRAVSAVRVNGSVVESSTYQWRESGQLIRVDPDNPGGSAAWPAGYGVVEVDLDWGYQSPPEDVAEAETKLVSNTVAGLAQLREGMVVQQDDVDLQVALPEAFTTEIKNILRNHRDGGRTAGVI